MINYTSYLTCFIEKQTKNISVNNRKIVHDVLL